MVQPTFPGVYIREVPSGARTITGVATSIAVFIGMTRRGPLDEPTRVLGFTDYARIFSDDTSTSETTDQVRQFFQNGGQQAFVVRIAKGAVSSTVTLKAADNTTNVLSLTSKSAGTDGDQLRATVDYNTGSPEITFNLRLFREALNASGQPVVTDDETLRELSMNPASTRYVQNVLKQESKLASGQVLGSFAPNPGFSASSRLFATDGDAVTAITTVTGTSPGDKGSFQIKLGSDPFVTVFLVGTDITTLADVATAITTATGKAVTVTRPSDTAQSPIIITRTGEDVQILPGSGKDLAVPLGFGVGQGGVEVGALAAFRPAPSGYVGAVNKAASALLPLRHLANELQSALTSVQLNPLSPHGFAPAAVALPSPAEIIAKANATANPSLLTVRDNLRLLADVINAATPEWRAEVHGYRLALRATFGVSTVGTGFSLVTASYVIADADQPFDPALGVLARGAATALGGGDDGDPPEIVDYTNAFDAIESKVDLFNIMVLPRTKTDDIRDTVWGRASTFCEQRRAFLIVDPSLNATDIDSMANEIITLRTGVVKDHAAVYWPPVTVVNNGGLRVNIDPSGSIAGIMARIDGSRGVFKAPAGLEADVRGIVGISITMSDAQNGILNPLAVNAIRAFPNGIVSWGARTMDGFDNSGDTDFKYVPVRRLELFIEESLVRGLKFAVFEPNDEQLWSQIRLAVIGFMNGLFRQGAFAGKTARDAFFVKVDSETTTQTDIDLGIVNVVVGFAPVKPAEFIIVTIQQKAGQVQV